jgi:hypothetical protein
MGGAMAVEMEETYIAPVNMPAHVTSTSHKQTNTPMASAWGVSSNHMHKHTSWGLLSRQFNLMTNDLP